ncbi:RNA-directed DNA polymerase [Thelohanellus kitauei]|uniref:RNA-directed DNA polymerase n=1 Tax=Thelohanellus kitauei TaxID=669202 RepID=A0A0C2M2J7_THEKT|nr:RNA-directed DNA polymerase [Thelohanellus kitauei]
MTVHECGSPIVPIRKYGSAKLHICGDYSAFVNKYLDEYRYPIPSVDDLLRQLKRYHYFTKVNLANAYNQIRLSPDIQKRLAICTHRGVFFFKRDFRSALSRLLDISRRYCPKLLLAFKM